MFRANLAQVKEPSKIGEDNRADEQWRHRLGINLLVIGHDYDACFGSFLWRHGAAKKCADYLYAQLLYVVDRHLAMDLIWL